MVTAMMKKLLATLALVALATTARAASVEVVPFGEQDGRTVYGLALSGDIKPGDDRRVASLLGMRSSRTVRIHDAEFEWRRYRGFAWHCPDCA